DEARIAATLHHPNTIQVYDVERIGTNVFFAMEFLHGKDVRTIFKKSIASKKAIGLSPALAIITSVCAGLHYAHEKIGSDGQPLTLVHRDVTPHNVFVTYEGSVKVIDFGIAKASHRLNQTQSTSLKGKFGYLSPEQAKCEPLDRRSDVFCIAILLY